MKTLIGKIVDRGAPTILIVCGIVMMAAAFVRYSGSPSGHSIVYEGKPLYAVLTVGLLLLVMGLGFYWWENIAGSWVGRRAVTTTAEGYVVGLGKDSDESEIRVVFGSIATVAAPPPLTGTFLLPTNEFFDRACYKYSNTSLGAFVNTKFPGPDYEAFLAATDDALRRLKPSMEEVEKEPGVRAISYGAGTCISLERPAGKEMNVVLAAVSTKRAHFGIRAEAAFIFEVVKKVQSTVSDQRFEQIVMPVLGSGEGGLRKEVALFMLVVALAETMTGPLRNKLKSVTIVIHTRNGQPEIDRGRVRRILGVGTAMF